MPLMKKSFSRSRCYSNSNDRCFMHVFFYTPKLLSVLRRGLKRGQDLPLLNMLSYKLKQPLFNPSSWRLWKCVKWNGISQCFCKKHVSLDRGPIPTLFFVLTIGENNTGVSKIRFSVQQLFILLYCYLITSCTFNIIAYFYFFSSFCKLRQKTEIWKTQAIGSYWKVVSI